LGKFQIMYCKKRKKKFESEAKKIEDEFTLRGGIINSERKRQRKNKRLEKPKEGEV